MTVFKLGFLTPSSNTVLEPAIASLLRDTPQITAHFARFRVLAINLGAEASQQFDPAPVLAAAEMLADAKVDSICWAGTSGSWLGFAQDEALCSAITQRTGIPATTATLALRDALRLARIKRLALVTPYLSEVQAAIIANLAREGFEITAERHLEDPGNYSFALHSAEMVGALMDSAVRDSPTEAVVVHCTNFRGLKAANDIEAQRDVLVVDSVAVSLWGGAKLAGAPRILLASRLFSGGN